MIKAVRSFIAETMLAFCKLNRIQFAAPWNTQRRGC